ncbi:Transposon Ty3-I gap-Pol polyprotein [Fasciola hepatica]|uniref:Transposon Ty3-I gap-Pol polyprotein n=1 Tax=Fasciola hepatica TaxID=6192 RepID=A0A4E0RA19_FASHE|nr:Transposon Ty3-I gap-Pol polyprotein [Fasciola hepatica]
MSVAAAPNCLTRPVASILVNRIPLQTLVDIGSSGSCIPPTVVRNHSWELQPMDLKITMASISLSYSTTGYCYVSTQYKHMKYEHFKLLVLPNLCAGVLLGDGFLSLHEKVKIPLGGHLGTFSLCGLPAAKTESLLLFSKLSSDCRPTATKSQRHTPEKE